MGSEHTVTLASGSATLIGRGLSRRMKIYGVLTMTVDVQGGDRYTVLRSYYYYYYCYLSTGMYRCLGLEILTDRLSSRIIQPRSSAPARLPIRVS